MRLAERARDLLARPAVAFALGWSLAFLYAYPGKTSWDSLVMLRGVREGGTTDAYAPLLELAWSATELVVSGPLGWVAIQIALFSLGCYRLLCRVVSPARAAWISIALLLFPPILAPLCVVWPQSMMVALLVAGAAGVSSERRSARIAGLVAILFACSAGDGAAIAAASIVGLLFVWSTTSGVRRYALAIAVWIGIALLARGANYALVEQETNVDAMTLAPFDIAGVIARTTHSDAALERELAGTGLRVHTDIKAAVKKFYRPRDFIRLVVEEGAPWRMPLVSGYGIDDEQADALRGARSRLVRANIGAYVVHRYAVAKEILGLGKSRPNPLVALEVRNDSVALARGITTRSSETQDTLTAIVTWTATTPLFVPWPYALLALVLLYFARHDRLAIALLVSGLARELAAFVYATAYDYRWSHWMICSTLLALALVIARRRART